MPGSGSDIWKEIGYGIQRVVISDNLIHMSLLTFVLTFYKCEVPVYDALDACRLSWVAWAGRLPILRNQLFMLQVGPWADAIHIS